MSRAPAASALPSGQAWVAAFVLLLAAKLVGIAAPLLYREIIDALSVPAVALVPIALILVYGLAHIGVQLVAGLRQLVFLRVAQRVGRWCESRRCEARDPPRGTRGPRPRRGPLAG